MTREEAINEIKSWAISSRNGREVLETLIPELRENEDESLKNKSGYYKAGKFWKASTLWNATKNKVPQRVPNRYILQECTWNIGNLQDFANEVKNVQEVSLDYPIILDMNGNIIDGAHRVVKAYLEGKDIDIVYIGDDEWPEPDYDEEKAVKESEDERIRKALVEYFAPPVPFTAVRGISVQKVRDWLEKKEKQKSVECIDFDNEFEKQVSHLLASVLNGEWEYDEGFVKHAAQSLLGYAKNELELDGKALLYTADKSYQIGFRDGVASVKPAEWSEEDEEMMADIIDSLEYAYPYDNEFRIAWLKSLRPQPKKELSIEKAIQWLDDTFYFLDNSSGRGRDCEIITHDFDSLEEMYDSFRKAVTVDSEPHWKPSEEQMKALQNAVALTACDKELARLYNQLKKL